MRAILEKQVVAASIALHLGDSGIPARGGAGDRQARRLTRLTRTRMVQPREVTRDGAARLGSRWAVWAGLLTCILIIHLQRVVAASGCSTPCCLVLVPPSSLYTLVWSISSTSSTSNISTPPVRQNLCTSLTHIHTYTHTYTGGVSSWSSRTISLVFFCFYS
jgi:hypothetical protein